MFVLITLKVDTRALRPLSKGDMDLKSLSTIGLHSSVRVSSELTPSELLGTC